MQCKTEMAIKRILLKKIIQEPNVYIGNNTITIFVDNDI